MAPLIPAAKPCGRPRSADMRRIVNGIFYVLRTGCAWRYLPREYGAWGTVYSYFRKFRLDGTWARIHAQLRALARLHAGRDPTPSAAIIDSQSVKTLMGGVRGYDGNKKLVGRKRHILVDTQGFLLSVVVHAASIPDRMGGQWVLEPDVFDWLNMGISSSDSPSFSALPAQEDDQADCHTGKNQDHNPYHHHNCRCNLYGIHIGSSFLPIVTCESTSTSTQFSWLLTSR